MRIRRNCGLKPILAFCLIIFLMSLPATAKERVPAWMTDWKSVFPDSQYIAQRGTGNSAELARTDALEAIARHLKSEVQTNLSTSFASDGDEETVEIRQDVLVTSQVELHGTEFTEPYQHKKVWYCVAYIDRAKAWAQLLPDMRVKETTFLLLLEKAQTEDEPFLAAAHFKSARENAQAFLAALEYGRLINSAADSLFASSKNHALAVPSLISTRMRGASVRLVCTGDAESIIRNAVAQKLEEAGFAVSDDGCCLAEVNIELNTEGNEPVAVRPALTLTVRGKNGSTVHSFQCRAEEKTAAYSLETARRRALTRLAETISGQFLSGL